MNIRRLLWFAAALMMAQAPIQAQESLEPEKHGLLPDPSFESAGQGPWLNHNFGPEFGIDWDAKDQKHGGNHSLKLWATQQSNADNLWEMTGARMIFPVNRGDIISGGAWLKWENLKDAEVFIECKWLDINQQEIERSSTDMVGIGTQHKTAGSGDWQYQDLEMWTVKERTAPAEASYVDIRLILLAAGTADRATGTVWWDDVEFKIQKRE